MNKNLTLIIIVLLVLITGLSAGIYFSLNQKSATQNPIIISSASFSSPSESSSSLASSTSTSTSTISTNSTSAIAAPNDPFWNTQWNLHATGAGIDALNAWSYEQEEVIVAVIDLGFMLNHEDLKTRFWKNTDEIAGNGKDDDKNGFTDDVNGYNFDNNTPNLITGTGHGTWVSGVIAAERNNGKGIAGVCGVCKIMAIQVGFELLEDEAARAAAAAKLGKAIDYAVKNGAKVVNMSFAMPVKSTSLQEKITNHSNSGVLFVAAAGNSNIDIDNSASAYPALYKNVFAVGALNKESKKTPSSNYGEKVTVAGPSAVIPLTNLYQSGASTPAKLKPIYNGDRYALETSDGGTSVAAPHLAGILGIIKSCNPGVTTAQIVTALNSGVLKRSKFANSETNILNSKLISTLCNQ